MLGSKAATALHYATRPGYYVSEHAGRSQPFTSWHILRRLRREVVGFDCSLTDALVRIARDPELTKQKKELQ